MMYCVKCGDSNSWPLAPAGLGTCEVCGEVSGQCADRPYRSLLQPQATTRPYPTTTALKQLAAAVYGYLLCASTRRGEGCTLCRDVIQSAYNAYREATGT